MEYYGAIVNPKDIVTKEYVDFHCGGSGTYILTYDENVTVGIAEVGTAITGTPNYTPSGDIRYTTDTVAEATSGELTYTYDNYVLTITGMTFTTTSKTVVTSVDGFEGNGVTFVIEKVEESE